MDIAIGMDHLAMDLDTGLELDLDLGAEPSLEFLLKPLTSSHVRRAFRGRKSLAPYLHSWDEIVYRNIKRVFKYKEFEKEWAHIASNEQRLMQRVIDRKKRQKARALRHAQQKASSSSSKRTRSGSSSSKHTGDAPIRPLRSGRSRVRAKESSKAIKPIRTSTSSSTASTSASKVSTGSRQSRDKGRAVSSQSQARERQRQSQPVIGQKAKETKFKVIHGCYYFYPSEREEPLEYDTLSSSTSFSSA